MRVILNIKDHAKALRFISFLETIEYVVIENVEVSNQTEVHQWQKQILDDRLSTRDKSKHLSERDLMGRIRAKYGI